MTIQELQEKRAAIVAEARTMLDAAGETITKDQQAAYDAKLAEADQLRERIDREQRQAELDAEIAVNQTVKRKAPAVLTIPRGDSEVRAMAHFFRTGDMGAIRGLAERDASGQMSLRVDVPTQFETRAVVDSTINITTAADGKSAVPVGLAASIAERKNEIMLAEKLGVTRVPGKGTTVNYAYENADPQGFTATSEQSDDSSTNNYTRDAVVLGTKAFTLAKYTKKLHLTEEVLEDEDANLLMHVASRVARGIANTHNSLLLTEVASNGTAFKTFASATAIAAGEPEDIVYNDTLGYYLNDGSSAAWVMRPSTFGNIASITGNARLYAQTPGGSFARELLGYNAYYSNNAAATAASAKDVYFGDWATGVGYREGSGVRFIIDPYTIDGVVQYKYSFRAIYGVIIAGAIGYGVHPSA